MYLAAIWRILEGMHTGGRWRLGHRPALDGLRGVAILLVMVSHAWPELRIFGNAGVTVFFALSGFLITSLLLDERARTGTIALRAFWVRRIRRLAPALALFVAVMLTAGLVGLGAATFAGAGCVAAYAGNWVIAFGGTSLGPMGHTWSLAIEEQFYLVWPLLVVAALLTKRPRMVLLVVVTAGILWAYVARVVLWNAGSGADRIYYGTDTRMDALLIGCGLAVLMTGRRVQRTPRAMSLPVDLTLITLVAVAFVTRDLWAAYFLGTPTVVPIVTAVILAGMTGGSYAGFLSAHWLQLVGQRAYALYLWHVPVFVIVHEVTTNAVAVVLVGSAISWGLAELSWRLVEAKDALLWRRHASGHAEEVRHALKVSDAVL